jgi:ABC-type phosphate transport system substrate-binding protein
MGYRFLIITLKNRIMKTTSLLSVLCLAAFSLVSFDVKHGAMTESIAVIVNKDNPVTTLSASEVKLYYLRRIKKRWPEIDKNIRPADQKKRSDERDAFYNLLGLNDSQVEQYFVTKQLQNAERPPDKFTTDADMINFVAEEIGAIGYIKASSATPEVMTKVKVVLTR